MDVASSSASNRQSWIYDENPTPNQSEGSHSIERKNEKSVSEELESVDCSTESFVDGHKESLKKITCTEEKKYILKVPYVSDLGSEDKVFGKNPSDEKKRGRLKTLTRQLGRFASGVFSHSDSTQLETESNKNRKVKVSKKMPKITYKKNSSPFDGGVMPTIILGAEAGFLNVKVEEHRRSFDGREDKVQFDSGKIDEVLAYAQSGIKELKDSAVPPSADSSGDGKKSKKSIPHGNELSRRTDPEQKRSLADKFPQEYKTENPNQNPNQNQN